MKASLVIVALLLILVPIGEDALCLEQNPGEILAQTSQSSLEENARGVAENELLVRFKEGTTTNQIALLNEKAGAWFCRALSFPDGLTIHHLKVDQNRVGILEAMDKYRGDSSVLYATPNYLFSAFGPIRPQRSPNDPYFKDQWALENTGQNGGVPDADIHAPEAWYRSTGSREVVIAVIDTGIQIDHPDLASNIWTNPGEIAGNGIDDDNNGYIDDTHGWDFRNNDSSVYDGIDWHGTHVAGIVGAVGNNGQGIAGVNWQVKIMPLKFLEYGVGQSADAIEALAYAARMGANIISNSWGRWGAQDPAMQDAIKSSGVLCLFAAGNSRQDNDVGFPNSTTYPSSYRLDNILSVAASDSSDNLASTVFWGSNWGRSTVDLAAPGLDILSLFPTDKSYPPYKHASGTSMATPYVAGVAGLLEGMLPARRPEKIKELILANVDRNGSLEGRLVAGGRLNAGSCLAGILDSVPPEVHLTLHPSSPLTDNMPTVRAYFEWEGSDNVTSKDRLLYSSFMEGYDEDWSAWSLSKSVEYFLPHGDYNFKVRACDEAGNFPEEQSSSTCKFSLEVSLPLLVYPNPLASGETVTIANIPSSSSAEVRIYDITGTLVRVLDEGEEIEKEGGSFTARWDSRSEMGEEVARGVYLYLISDGTKKKKIGKIAVLD